MHDVSVMQWLELNNCQRLIKPTAGFFFHHSLFNSDNYKENILLACVNREDLSPDKLITLSVFTELY
jgi:hypothetical protein